MEPVVATTLFTTGVESLSSTYTHIASEKELNPKSISETTTTVLAMAPLSTAITTRNNKKKQEEKYARTYVDSMTDEELANALEKMNLMLKEDNSTEKSK